MIQNSRRFLGGMTGVFAEESDLQAFLQTLSNAQALTGRMMIAVRKDRWHVAVSLLRKDLGLDPEHRSWTRRMADFVAQSLRRAPSDDVEAGSTLVEDLPIAGGIGLSDVVVSWADSGTELEKEVNSIRACLDALGIFDADGQKMVEELHGDAAVPSVGDISVQYDRVKHETRIGGNLNLGTVLAALGHLLPGSGGGVAELGDTVSSVGKFQMGGTVKLKMAYRDSREQFIGALLALQLDAGGRLRTCAELQEFRAEWNDSRMTAEKLQQEWTNTIQPARAFLEKSLTAIDAQMQPAYTVHPMGGSDKLIYQHCMDSVQHGDFTAAIRTLERIQHPLIPIKKAIGDTFYLFAANVVMQAQIARFEDDLEHVLQERFGQTLHRDASDTKPVPPSVPESAADSPPVTPPASGHQPPAVRRRGWRP